MPEVADPANSASVPNTTNHSVLSIRKVVFSANHPVDRDARGPFPAPEFLSRRLAQWPVCYTRNKNIKLTATFTVMAPPTATETVKVKGVARLGTATLEWTDSVSVSPGSTEVTTGELNSSAALPNQVACYDPAVIEWEFEPPGVPAGQAGNSDNLMYVTLGDPNGTPPYWTLLDYSCRAAAGSTNAYQLVTRAFSPFSSRDMTRRYDDTGLTYWNPISSKKGPNARSTRQLLLNGNGTLPNGGSGECGSWADFLIDMYKVHGETGVKIIVIKNVPEYNASVGGFLVKNWGWRATGSLPAPYTHTWGVECVSRPPYGIPGQRQPNPPPAFRNHFIVEAMGQWWDPSYGGGPFASQLEWERVAIEGLYAEPPLRCGYPKSWYPNDPLVQFWPA
jgi:hypothetical protein